MARAEKDREEAPMTRDFAVKVRLSAAEVARLDEIRGPTNRAEYLRRLLQGPPPQGEPTHIEAISILYGLAKDGRVGAAVALERALRAEQGSEPDGELARLLRGE
jgi:hypothetical protein